MSNPLQSYVVSSISALSVESVAAPESTAPAVVSSESPASSVVVAPISTSATVQTSQASETPPAQVTTSTNLAVTSDAGTPTTSANSIEGVTTSTTAEATTGAVTSTATRATLSTTKGTATGTAASFAYTQLVNKNGEPKLVSIPQALVVNASYPMLCPQGNCLQDCQNMTRLFQAIPDGIDESISVYGKTNAITLFGVCSNLQALSGLAQTNNDETFTSYFPTTASAMALRNVTDNVGVCLLETCQKTRDPALCAKECALSSLQSSNTSLSVTGIHPCMARLCSNTCGLPYASQDVYGVGLLASYFTQAILVLVLAGVFVTTASWRVFAHRDMSRPVVSKRLKESLETFLTAQCYFGMSASIASYFLRPSTIDPLNGYALLSVAITGFIPPTFTLLLLHSHGMKSWYTTFMTFASWALSSVLFFMLMMNLLNTTHNARAIDRGLSALFEVSSCGKSSAMSLCQQTFGTDPLEYLTRFYNNWNIPNIKNVPILWVLSTVVLLCLMVLQLMNGKHDRKFNAAVRLGSLYVGSILFGLALAYQARMVIAYTRMDVIDWSGWTFGQVVALLFWVPAVLECLRLYTKQWREDRHKNKNAGGYAKLATTPNPGPPSPAFTQPASPNSSMQRQSASSLEPLRTQHPMQPVSQATRPMQSSSISPQQQQQLHQRQQQQQSPLQSQQPRQQHSQQRSQQQPQQQQQQQQHHQRQPSQQQQRWSTSSLDSLMNQSASPPANAPIELTQIPRKPIADPAATRRT